MQDVALSSRIRPPPLTYEQKDASCAAVRLTLHELLVLNPKDTAATAVGEQAPPGPGAGSGMPLSRDMASGPDVVVLLLLLLLEVCVTIVPACVGRRWGQAGGCWTW